MTYPLASYISRWTPLAADTTQKHTVRIEDSNGAWFVEEGRRRDRLLRERRNVHGG